jgi:hypothetical protein
LKGKPGFVSASLSGTVNSEKASEGQGGCLVLLLTGRAVEHIAQTVGLLERAADQ